ncbi:type IX secretion system membrane protein PorP/SprF, partial [uncultured Muribaculum sp.]
MARINRILSLIAVTVASLAVTVDAQVDMMMTNYVEALNYYNAAAIGTSDYLRVRVGGRWDRIGADPAPKSFMLTGDMPLPLLGNKLAAGVVAQRESIGLYRNITAGLQCGYKITTGRSSSVTLAVQAGIIDNEFRWSERELPESDAASDEAGDIPIEDQRHSAMDLSLGAFYNSRHFWAGVSVTHLTR